MTDLFTRIPEEKRIRVMQAAMEEFASNGYDHANTNRIATLAGISVGSLFKYCSNKEDLFLSTVRYGATKLREELGSITAEGQDIFAKIETILRIVQRHSRRNIIMIRLYNEMTFHGRSQLVLREVQCLESFTAELYSRLISDAKARGEIRADCDSRMFSFLLDNLFMMLQFSYACDYYRERFKVYVNGDILDQDDFVVDQTMKFIRSALVGRKSPAQ